MSDQGTTYAAYIEAALKAESDRRTSLDSRALAVVSTSSGLLTLLFALTVLITGDKFRVSTQGARGVAVSLLFFMAAAVTGLFANKLWPYDVADVGTLRRLITDRFGRMMRSTPGMCAPLSTWQL